MFTVYRGGRAEALIPKTPRPYKKQNSRDKHDFCDFYISACVKRRNYLHNNFILPKKVGVITCNLFFVDCVFKNF